MSDVQTIEGRAVLDAAARIAVISTRWNSFIVDHLEAGCLDALERHATVSPEVTVVKAPGAFELPLIARKLAESGNYDAVIALGAVIRGSTAHFEHVAGAASRGLANVSVDSGVPVIFGVLTTDTIEQAVERAGTKAGNKGAEAATTAIEMISLMRQL
ncbi:MAG: 6,7-dimethyl-8-ribityllumazine synthase [Gammaproteobacteria bacterium]